MSKKRRKKEVMKMEEKCIEMLKKALNTFREIEEAIDASIHRTIDPAISGGLGLPGYLIAESRDMLETLLKVKYKAIDMRAEIEKVIDEGGEE